MALGNRTFCLGEEMTVRLPGAVAYAAHYDYSLVDENRPLGRIR